MAQFYLGHALIEPVFCQRKAQAANETTAATAAQTADNSGHVQNRKALHGVTGTDHSAREPAISVPNLPQRSHFPGLDISIPSLLRRQNVEVAGQYGWWGKSGTEIACSPVKC